MTDLDSAAIMAEHQSESGWDQAPECWTCETPWPCLPYRLAADLAKALQLKSNVECNYVQHVLDSKVEHDRLAAENAALREALNGSSMWPEYAALHEQIQRVRALGEKWAPTASIGDLGDAVLAALDGDQPKPGEST